MHINDMGGKRTFIDWGLLVQLLLPADIQSVREQQLITRHKRVPAESKTYAIRRIAYLLLRPRLQTSVTGTFRSSTFGRAISSAEERMG